MMSISIKRLNQVLSICLALIVAPVSAQQHLNWTWQLDRSAFNDSLISILIDEKSTSSYEFSCDLSGALLETSDEESSATINTVVTELNPEGLLVVTCRVGAHSEQIVIIDPFQNKQDVEFIKVGSYFVDWSLNDGQLWLKYDEPCQEIESKVCDIPFSTVDMIWPSIKQ